MPAEPSNNGTPGLTKIADRFGSDKLDIDDLNETEHLRPTPGISCQVREAGWRSDEAEIDNLEVDDHRRKFARLERLANTSENERVRILQEFAAVESANGILSAEVARLKDQVEAARGKLRNSWDFIFRLKAKHVAELARLEAELTTSGLPKLRAVLADLQRQNNALRLENAEQKQAWERMSAELAKRKAETIQLARERDQVRSKIALRLTSKLWLFKRLFHL